MKTSTTIHLSDHARLRMHQRDISSAHITCALTNPTCVRDGGESDTPGKRRLVHLNDTHAVVMDGDTVITVWNRDRVLAVA